MIELVLYACLLSAPQQCTEERMEWSGGLLWCAVGGQVVAADWARKNPGYGTPKWSCGPVRRST